MLFIIFSSLLPVFGILALGLLAARHSLLPANAASCLNQYVYWIALPSMFFTQLALMDSALLSAGLFAGLCIGMLTSYLPCFFAARAVNRRHPERAILFACVGTFPNVMFMAVPIVSFLLPGNREALLVASLAALLYLPNLLYTDVMLEMQRHKGEPLRQYLRSLGKTVLRNPSIVAPGCGLAINACGFSPPVFITNMTGMLGATAAPCALFAIGMVLQLQLASAGSLPQGWLLRQLPTHVTKLFLMPLFTFFALRQFGLSEVALGVATLCAGMPSAIACNVLAEKYQVSVKDTAMGICCNTAASLFSLYALIAVMFLMKIF